MLSELAHCRLARTGRDVFKAPLLLRLLLLFLNFEFYADSKKTAYVYFVRHKLKRTS